MSLSTPEPLFLQRFEQIWASLRRFQVRQGLCWSVLVAAIGLGLLVVADYRLELPWRDRMIGLAVAAACVVAVFWLGVIVPLRWWTRPRTAVEIEERFPQLGQRIRTIVQYAGLPEEIMNAEGVAPTLVGALTEETETKVHPLPLDSIVPWWRVWVAAALAAVPVLVLATAALIHPEWRIALQRALLSDRPYTTVLVAPGNITVEQGESVPIAIELKGRPRREVVLYTRPGDGQDTPWTTAVLDATTGEPASRRQARLEKVKDPIEYRVVAGPAASRTLRIGVRYPLAIKAFDIALKPPAYTGIEPSTVKGGDLQIIEGTRARFQIAFDAPTVEASLILSELPDRTNPKKKTPPPHVISLKAEGKVLTADLSPTADLDYRIVARTADNRVLPKNGYRIAVREDRAPRVAFDEPDEALEVHPIAEVMHRIRVGDDFGLSKAGIVFRANNGDEQTLVLRDFTPKTGRPKIAAALEETLLLEKLALTQTDSVTYYAFAEDNYPNGPKRTETDLRYIDIRPFKRTYKLADPGSPGDEESSASLEELIARQRFNLNRTVRLARHHAGDKTEAEDPLKISGFEEALAGMTREFAEGLEGLAGQRIEPLHQAEESMLAAVEALDHGKNTEAPPHEADALRNLIKVRDTFRMLIANDPAAAAKMRSFDRKQAQKIRKPKGKDEEAEELAEKLEELAQDEDFVYATIAALSAEGEEGKKEKDEKGEEGEKTEEGEKPDQDAMKDAEKPKEERGSQAEKGEEGQKGEKGQKGQGQKGQKGMKGERGQEGENGEKGQSQRGQKGPKGERGKDQEKNEKGQGKKDPKGEGGEGKEKEKGRKGSQGLPDSKAKEMAAGKGNPSEDEKGEGGSGKPKKESRREIAERQEQIADEVRELEEKLKRLEVASELAKARMAKAAEKTEKAAGALARGNSKEAADDAKAGAGMLHELARQVKGEIAREPADQVAMARDLANELAEREAELGDMHEGSQPPGSQGDKGETPGKGEKGETPGKGEKGDTPGKGEKGEKGEKEGQGSKGTNGKGQGGAGGWGSLTEAEKLERLEEEALTLEDWLKEMDKRGEGKAAETVRDLLDQGTVAEVVKRMDRIGELYGGGKKPEARREATEVARSLEVLSQSLDMLHRGIVAPQLAELVNFDKRVADLVAKMNTLKTDAEVNAWHRQAVALLHDLEEKGVASGGVDDLRAALEAGGWRAGGGSWHWDGAVHDHWLAPGHYTTSLQTLTVQIQDKIQDLILKDLVSARDEATPPEYKELVERYYEVLSKNGKGK